MFLALLIGGWLVCGVFAYGTTYAHFQRKFPHFADSRRGEQRLFAVGVGLSGPVELLVVVSNGGCRHGLKWW